MLETSLNLDFEKLRNLFKNQIQEYISVKRKSILKSLAFAVLLLSISVLLIAFSGSKYHFVPWNIVLGIFGLYFLFKASIDMSKAFIRVNKWKSQSTSYIAKLKQTKLISYKVTDQVIQYFIDEKLNNSIEWSGLSSIIEKEGYFYLIFDDPKNNILMPEFAVTEHFYDSFLQLAKGKIEATSDQTS